MFGKFLSSRSLKCPLDYARVIVSAVMIWTFFRFFKNFSLFDLILVRMGNESVKGSRRKTPKKENDLYPTHKSVEEMLNRGSDQLSGIGSPDGSLKLMNLDKKTSDDPHQQALLVSTHQDLLNKLEKFDLIWIKIEKFYK